MVVSNVHNVLQLTFPNLSLTRQIGMDAEYVVPTKDYVLKSFLKHYRRYLEAYGARFWEEEEFDCDDFAFEFWMELKRAHRLTPGRPKKSAVAAGVMLYMSQGEGYHAACWVIVWNGKNSELLTLEPQTGANGHLTHEERKSCDTVIF